MDHVPIDLRFRIRKERSLRERNVVNEMIISWFKRPKGLTTSHLYVQLEPVTSEMDDMLVIILDY